MSEIDPQPRRAEVIPLPLERYKVAASRLRQAAQVTHDVARRAVKNAGHSDPAASFESRRQQYRLRMLIKRCDAALASDPEARLEIGRRDYDILAKAGCNPFSEPA